MKHMEDMFQDLTFLLQKVPKNHNQFCHFRHGGGTHLLVFAQTLINVLLILDYPDKARKLFIQNTLSELSFCPTIYDSYNFHFLEPS